ncbi:uncharacterized protein VNE69_01317 [Vairimorpha necatrix]|uniref:Uncharacterized protein n=1 Tax=Vairimorpha necatrix TaxID=6039 RepID=A0AAX4J8S5_9MICR
MNELLLSVFKPTCHVKFTNTDCDYQNILSLIIDTGLFNIKKKSTKFYEIGNDLLEIIYKDEIYVFKEIVIYIVQTESDSIHHILLNDFYSGQYITKLNKIYQSCFPTDESSFYKMGTSMLKSILLDTYMEDKNKADSYFLAKKYDEAYKLYSKYRNYNDFSHYCIEMSVYCKFKYEDIPSHFVDTFYYKRLVFLLLTSREYDFLCYQVYKSSTKIIKNIMYELGERLFKTKKFKRKGLELMYFNGQVAEEDLDFVFNGILKKNNFQDSEFQKSFQVQKSNELEYLDIWPMTQPFNLRFPNFTISNFKNLYFIDQYQELKIHLNVNETGKYIFNNSEHDFDQMINLTVKFKKLGLHKKELILCLDKKYKFHLYFFVVDNFPIKIRTDYRLKDQIFIKLENQSKNLLNINSKYKFKNTSEDIIDIYKKNILGLDDLISMEVSSLDVINDPIMTDLDFKKFLVKDLNIFDTSENVNISLDNRRHKLEIKRDDIIYKILINKKQKQSNKIFIYIFNTYTISEQLKLNMLVNNYKKSKLFLEISNSKCEVLDDNFVVPPQISGLYEFRCKNFTKEAEFEIKVRNENKEFLDYDLIVEYL